MDEQLSPRFNDYARVFMDTDRKFDKALKGEIATGQIIETSGLGSTDLTCFTLYQLFSLYISADKSLFHNLRAIFINNKPAYYKTMAWKIKRDFLIGYYGKCILCGKNYGTFQVHHNNYQNVPCEDFLDLILLCEKCHSEYHNKSKKEQNDRTTH